MSRSIGDRDAGRAVLALPHMQQVLLPSAGCRLILATDGVWDSFPKEPSAALLLRSQPLVDAAYTLCSTASKRRRLVPDDTSAVVVDLLPSSNDTFKAHLARLRQAGLLDQQHASPGGPANSFDDGSATCGCFGGRSKPASTGASAHCATPVRQPPVGELTDATHDSTLDEASVRAVVVSDTDALFEFCGGKLQGDTQALLAALMGGRADGKQRDLSYSSNTTHCDILLVKTTPGSEHDPASYSSVSTAATGDLEALKSGL